MGNNPSGAKAEKKMRLFTLTASILAIVISAFMAYKSITAARQSANIARQFEAKLEKSQEKYSSDEAKFNLLNKTLSSVVDSMSKLKSENVRLLFYIKLHKGTDRFEEIKKTNSVRWKNFNGLVTANDQLDSQERAYLHSKSVRKLIVELRCLIAWNSKLYWNVISKEYSFMFAVKECKQNSTCFFPIKNKDDFLKWDRCIRDHIVNILNYYNKKLLALKYDINREEKSLSSIVSDKS